MSSVYSIGLSKQYVCYIICRIWHISSFLIHVQLSYIHTQSFSMFALSNTLSNLFDFQRYPSDKNHSYSFNKAMMMNIAFIEASKLSDYDCFVFHDVDFVAEDDRSMYMCRELPLHLGAYHDNYNYRYT